MFKPKIPFIELLENQLDMSEMSTYNTASKLSKAHWALFDWKESAMAGLNERIRKARTDLHLSQEYVANFLGIGRSSVAEMESGKRSVKAEELEKLSDLFLIPVEVLLKGTQTTIPSQMFARGFDQLDEADQQEILNLIEFKRAMKARA